MSIPPYKQISIFDFLNNKDNSLNIATMCSGIGTPEIAFKELGVNFKTIFACEINKFARKTYLYNHEINECDFHNDIANFDASKYLNQIDILVFGSPCQPFSIAGFRKGFDDPRGAVFFEGIKRIEECKPKIIIFENVKGLLSHDKGETYKIVQDSFLKIGYTIQCKVFNAIEHGSNQKRERLFIVAFKTKEIELNFNIDDFDLKTTTAPFEDLLEDEVDSKYWISSVSKDYMQEDYNDKKRIEKGLQLKSRHEHLSVNDTSNKYAFTITASYSKGNPHNVLVDESTCRFGFWSCDFVCSGMCEHCNLEDELNYQYTNIPTAAYRRLTPRECARLQGIPDSFSFKQVSDTQAYIQIGNSMDISTLKELFTNILENANIKLFA